LRKHEASIHQLEGNLRILKELITQGQEICRTPLLWTHS